MSFIYHHGMKLNCIGTSHMSGGLDCREKNSVQKLGYPMLVQPILSQKMEKSKFFNEPLFCNRDFRICHFCHRIKTVKLSFSDQL